MSGYAFTSTARRDLKSIWRYIAQDSPRYADLVEEAILATCGKAAALPELGHRREGIRDQNVLFLTVAEYKRYSIAYLAGSDPLIVVRVVHGSRDVPKLF